LLPLRRTQSVLFYRLKKLKIFFGTGIAPSFKLSIERPPQPPGFGPGQSLVAAAAALWIA